MVFRILGFEIRWTSKRDRRRVDDEPSSSTQLLLASENQQERVLFSDVKSKLGRFDFGGRKILTMAAGPKPWESIIYPEPDMSDPWSQTALSIAVNEMEKRFNFYRSFSICLVDDVIKQFRLSVTPLTKVSYDKLHSIHCVKFDQIHPEVYRQIPALVTHVFTEGRVVPDFI